MAKRTTKKAKPKTKAKAHVVVQPGELQRRARAKRMRERIAAAADPEDNFRTSGRGPHTSYKPEYAKVAASLCKLGATDKELADHFDVDVRTIKNWEKHYPSFFKALERGKEAADARVERALYSKAMGYTYESEKIFFDAKNGEVVRAETLEHVPPSDTAISLWLRNRKPAEWRDKVDHDHSHAHFHTRDAAVTVADAQALFRQARNMPLDELQRSMKLIESPVTIDNVIDVVDVEAEEEA